MKGIQHDHETIYRRFGEFTSFGGVLGLNDGLLSTAASAHDCEGENRYSDEKSGKHDLALYRFETRKIDTIIVGDVESIMDGLFPLSGSQINERLRNPLYLFSFVIDGII